MKRPKPKNIPIDARRLRGWINEFSGYRQAVGEYSIASWINQFEGEDRDLGARVLDVVDFYGVDRIAAAFRRGLKMIPGWHAKPSQRRGRWRFVPYTRSAGKSGDGMLYHFRVANDLDSKSNDKMFIHPSDLVLEKLGPDDTVVFVDDLVATGDQVIEAWSESFAELLPTAGRVYLLVVAAVRGARKRINKETELRLVAAHDLDEEHNLFAGECDRFTTSEKESLLRYNKRADTKRPRGYGDCGLVVVFSHRCPNNSVPILHAWSSEWTGLFPRHDS